MARLCLGGSPTQTMPTSNREPLGVPLAVADRGECDACLDEPITGGVRCR